MLQKLNSYWQFFFGGGWEGIVDSNDIAVILDYCIPVGYFSIKGFGRTVKWFMVTLSCCLHAQ